jgi:molecular chaperone HtpG
VLDATGPGVTVGPSILGLVTSGNFNDPLTIYREYIQNAVDELSRQNGFEGKVDIVIDPRQKKVSISDNGPGLTHQECLEDLVPISKSKKCLGRDRGFRGVGRLSGLAFAESVSFLTRASALDPVTRVVWLRTGLADQIDSIQAPEQGFQNCVRVETLDDSDYPDHFFRVDIGGVSRHSAGMLLNREAVRGYIAEVCPVPLAPNFPFAENICAMFPPQLSPYSLRITLDGKEQPIQREYGSEIALGGNKVGHFSEYEEIRVPSIDGKQDAAGGWIAHWSSLGAIPKANRIRGIRARLGNIQVGDERVFDHLFEEERFNRWCVGEMHILDQRIIPNGRRDYFELNPHLRNLENHLSPIFRQITARCRSASSNRNKEKKLMSIIADIEAMYELAASGCLAANDAESFIKRALEQLIRACREIDRAAIEAELDGRLGAVEIRLRNFHPNGNPFPLTGISTSEVDTYRKVFGAVARRAPSPRSAREIIDAVLKESEGLHITSLDSRAIGDGRPGQEGNWVRGSIPIL